jgi:TP901 family phage tail tape measure protein
VTQVGEASIKIGADLSGFDKTLTAGVESALKDVEREVDKASKRIGDSLKEAGAKIGDVGKKMSAVGGDLTKKVTLPIVGVGSAAIGAAKTVDEALRDIRVGTGRTGETLQQLEADFDKVARNSSGSIERVGTVIADLNTRLGLTGQPMQDLAYQVLALEQILGGTEVNLDTLTRVFGAFQVAPEEYGETLDVLFRASQATGVQFDQLQGLVVGQSAAFGELGFSLNDTIAILGQFEKAGVNTETVLAGLRANIVKAAGEGVSAGDFFREGVKGIEEFLAAGDEAGAQAAAKELFGARTFLDALDAIRRGQFNIDDTVDKIENGEDTITGLAAETEQFGDKFAKFKNQMTLSLAPLGEKLIPLLTTAMEKLVPMIERIIERFQNLSPRTKTIIGVVVALAAALGPVILVVGKVVSIVGGFVVVIGKLIPVIALLFTPVGAIVLGIAALVAIIIIVIKNFDAIRDAIGRVVDAIGDFISGALQAVKDAFTSVWETVKDVWDKITGAIETAIAFIVDTAFAVFHGALDAIMVAFTAVKDFIADTIETIASFIGTVFQGIADFITEIMDTIIGAITDALTFIFDLFKKYLGFMQELVRTVFRTIRTIIRTVLRAIQTIVTTILESIWGVFEDIFSTIQGVVSEVFGFIQGVISGTMDTISGIISDVLNGIKTTFETIWNGLRDFIGDVLGGIVDFVKEKFDDIVSFLAGIPKRVTDLAVGMFDGIKEAFRGALNFIIRGWNSLNFRIPGFRIGPVGYDGFTLGLPKIPELANGAIVSGPQVAMIGEAGAEAVIPLSRPRRAMQLMEQSGLADLARDSGAVVNIEYATFATPSDADLVAQKVNAAYRARVLVA